MSPPPCLCKVDCGAQQGTSPFFLLAAAATLIAFLIAIASSKQSSVLQSTQRRRREATSFQNNTNASGTDSDSVNGSGTDSTIREIRDCIDEIGLASSDTFTTIDLTSGFWQQALDKASRPMTSFTVPGKGTRCLLYTSPSPRD